MGFDESDDTITGSPALSVILPEGGEARHLLRERETTIGRDPSNHICITNHLVSSFHAKIIHSGEIFSLVDLGSANKTRVNGRPVVQKTVNCGDEIHFAGVVCRLVAPPGTVTEECSPSEGGAKHGADRSFNPAPEVRAVSGAAHPISDSGSAKWKPPVSKFYLTGGVLVLFSIVAALATRVC